MDYKSIIAQALRKGFQPYAGNDAQQQVMIDGLEVSPYFELTGQSEQEGRSPQQMGYSISTPLGGTTYRTDVVDMDGNVLRSHEHDAGEDKYGLRDMSKLALAALGANYLPGMFGGGEAAGVAGAGEASGLLSGSLTSGITPAAIAAGEAALPGTIGSLTAGLTPATIAAAEAGLPGAAGALTAGAGTGLLSDAAQQIVVTGSKAAAPALLPAVVPAAAATLAATTLASNPTGSLTDGVTPDSVAKTEAGLPKEPGPLDSLKAWAVANPELAKLLFSGGGALLSAAGGPSSNSPGGYVDSGYRPTISRGGFNAAPQARQMAAQPTGLLMAPTTGQTDSGLWRYAGGLLGTPSAPNTPTMTPPTVAPPPMRVMPPPSVTPPPIRATPPAPAVRPMVTPASALPTNKPAQVGASAGALYQVPSWAFTDLDPTEKAALYNSFRSRGFNDDYIRTIADRTQPQSATDWSALGQLAQQMPQGLIAGDQAPTKATIQQAVAGWRAQQPATVPAPAIAPPPVAPPPAAQTAVGVPYTSPADKFKAYMYEGGANDNDATRRGLGYARLMGWSPDESVRTWNDALGTKFSTDDYQRALKAYGFEPSGLLGG